MRSKEVMLMQPQPFGQNSITNNLDHLNVKPQPTPSREALDEM